MFLDTKMPIVVKTDFSKIQKKIDLLKANMAPKIETELIDVGDKMLGVIEQENYQVLETLESTMLKEWAGKYEGEPYFSFNKGIIHTSSDPQNVKVERKDNKVDFGFGNYTFMDTARNMQHPGYEMWRMLEFSQGQFPAGKGYADPTHVFTDTFYFFRDEIRNRVRIAVNQSIDTANKRQ
jgi:hypothetical protein